MSKSIVITVLVENSVKDRELLAEHGLAFHIQTEAGNLLFDCGQSGLLTHNARHLGVDLSRVSSVALSHGHYDHTGGLGAVYKLAPDAKLYAHPAVLNPHFARNNDGSMRNVGMSESSLEAIRCRRTQWHETRIMTEVLKGIFLTGEIPCVTDFEKEDTLFVVNPITGQPDAMADDQALFFDTAKGVVVLLGCAHAGVVNTLRHIQELVHGRRIHTVLGGMHLHKADPNRINLTVNALRKFSIQEIHPAHCTGSRFTARLWHEFPQSCADCLTGSRYIFYEHNDNII